MPSRVGLASTVENHNLLFIYEDKRTVQTTTLLNGHSQITPGFA